MGNEINFHSQIHVCSANRINLDQPKSFAVSQNENEIEILDENQGNPNLVNFLNTKFKGRKSATKQILFQLTNIIGLHKQNSEKITSNTIDKLEESQQNNTSDKLGFTFDKTDSILFDSCSKPYHLTRLSYQQTIKLNSEPSDIRKFRASFQSYKFQYKQLKIKQSSFVKVRNTNSFQVSYQILEKIGEGTTGTVYKAKCRRTNAIRAVKIMKTKILKRLNQTQKIHFQLNILRTFDHPNIIKVYDVFFTEKFYYVVTEYCAGGTLLEYVLKNSTIDKRLIQIIMKQLLGALSYIHDQAIIHRDIKLENIVLDVDPKLCTSMDDVQIKIIDFGLAMKAKFKTMNKDEPSLGTPLYMAPQILKGSYSDKCDVWSCGVIMHYLLFKEFPYYSHDVTSIYQKILTEELDMTSKFYFKVEPYWKKISEAQKELLCSLLERNFFRRKSALEVSISQWLEEAYDFSKQVEKDLVLRKLSQYKKQNNFIRLIESYLVFLKTSNEQQRKMIALFHKFDKNCNGVIDLHELKQIFESNHNTEESYMVEMLAKIDKNNSGKIQISEFFAFLSDRNKLFTEVNLQEAFDFLDQNKNGYIDRIQLKKALEGCDKEEYKLLWKDIDKNADERISKEQFMEYLLRMEDISE